MKLGLQGVSVLIASGDNGAANSYNANVGALCVTSQYGYLAANGTQFAPSFPASCPYIISVRATQLKTPSIYGDEVAATVPDAAFYSGGGFSNIFERPAYQDGAVSKYLRARSAGVQPHRPRHPDISALGVNITTVYHGVTVQQGGISAAAPLFALLISLLNEERIHACQKPLGFLNPTLYKHPEMFHDVVMGSNPGRGTNGFSAAKGWDPMTGMGTPNYEKMKEVFLRLPSGYGPA